MLRKFKTENISIFVYDLKQSFYHTIILYTKRKNRKKNRKKINKDAIILHFSCTKDDVIQMPIASCGTRKFGSKMPSKREEIEVQSIFSF